ncbi:hypothetical protein AYO40_04910 [Planctomycetaceae bacterium SCGC AG-212-D15]|nr:hypothetical protein AYO40_04910 [Planctomycetaceae bacterium SCGC AG-212-D15]
MRQLRLIGILFGLIALVLGAVSLWSIMDARGFIANAERTEGVVVGLAPGTKSTVYGVIQFQAEGREVRIRSRTASSPPAYSVGQKVTVLYVPGELDEARVESFWEQYLLAVITGSIGLVFFLIALGMIGIPYLGERRRRLAFSMGTPVTAKVVEVRLASVKMNGQNPWMVVADYTDMEGTKHTFVSEYLWTNPEKDFPVGSAVTVYYLPERPSVYAFDLANSDRGRSL